MKLTHIALVLALALLGVTGWLAWTTHLEARSLRNQNDLLKTQASAPSANDDALKAAENQMIRDQIAAQANARISSSPAPLPPPSASTPVARTAAAGSNLPPVSAPLAAPAMPVPQLPAASQEPALPANVAALAANGHVGPAALASVPPPLSSQQRVVLGAPAIAKVTEYQKDYGFVIIAAGSDKKLEKGMTFALRRGPGIVGRIEITEVENNTAVGNIKSSSIPAGVTIQVGDEVIQDLPSNG